MGRIFTKKILKRFLLFQGWSNPQWGPDNGDISVFAISSRTTLVLGQTGFQQVGEHLRPF